MSVLQTIFQDYDLYVNALVASLLISYAAAPIGVFLNLKRMTLMGEAISHSLMPGFALAFMMYGMSYAGLILGGLFAGLLVLGLMMGLNRFVTIKEDGVLTVIYLTFSALGLLIVLKSGIKIDLSHILIGNILLIDDTWLLILFASSVLIRFIFSRIRKNLLIVLMDPEYAQFLGIPIQQIKSIFYFLVLWILVLCFYSVGTLLALGLLLVPALIGKVLVKPINSQIRYALLIGAAMSLLGLTLSVGLDWPTGPTIILSGGILFILAVGMRSSVLKAGIVLVIGLLGFQPNAEAAFFSSLQAKNEILLSTPYLKLFVNHLVKPDDKIVVETLIPNDQSIHNYQLKPSDLKKIKKAKVFLYIGNGLEDGLKEQVAKVNSAARLVNLTGVMKAASSQDAHFWLNPEWTLTILESIKATLIIEKSELKSVLDTRLEAARKELQVYVKQTQERFHAYKGRSVLISHNSLYFLRNLLGIDVYFYTQSTSPSDVLNIKKILKNGKVPLVKEYGSADFFLDSLVKEYQRSYSGEVYGEIVPPDFYDNKSYLDILKINLDVIHDILKKDV